MIIDRLRKIVDLDFSGDRSPLENMRTKTINQLCLVGFLILGLSIVASCIFNKDNFTVYREIMWFAIFGLPFVINFYKKYRLAKFLILATPIVAITSLSFIYGLEQRAEATYLFLVILSFFFLDFKKGFIIAAVILLTYCFVVWFNMNHEAPLKGALDGGYAQWRN